MIEAVKKLEISEQTYYRWWKEYGGLDMTQARKLIELEKENARLKKLVADISLDNAILKEVQKKARTGGEKRFSEYKPFWAFRSGEPGRAIGQPRAAQRYQRQPADDEEQLRA